MDRKNIPLLLVSVALLVVCGLCAITVYGTYAWLSTRQANVRFFDYMHVSASVTETESYPAKSNLIIDSDSGDITILAEERTDFEVEMVKTGWGADQAEAEQAANAIQVVVQETGEALRLTYRVPDDFGVAISRGGPDSVDFTVRVPSNTVVEISGRFGDVSLTGLTDQVDVEADFGDLVARDIEAGENAVRLVTSFGDLTVENAQGTDLFLESSNGKITGTNLSATGTVEINNSFGSIHLDGLSAASLSVTSQNGYVEVLDGDVAGDLTVTNQFGDIDVQNVQATSYTLESQNGTVQLDGPGGEVKVSNHFGEIVITNGIQVTLDLENDNGDIAFSGTLNPEAQHLLQSSFGDISLTIPEDSAFGLTLETSFGQIDSEIPVALTGSLEENSWEATINGGGSLITATTSNGNISLHVLANGGE